MAALTADRVPFSEVTAHRATLEEAYMELTRDAVEYRAAAVPRDGAMTTITPYRSTAQAGRDGFGQLLHAEWTKFRTVRGWVIGMIVAVLVTAGLGLFVRRPAPASVQSASSGPAAPAVRPAGPRCRWGRAASR